MPGIARLTDQVTCTCSCHQSPVSTTGTINSASVNVTVNGLGVARVGDTALCTCGHTTTIIQGSPNITVNGIPLARLGDPVDGCPVGTITTSSMNVIAN